MEYSRIVAVTGLPGLYEVLSSKTDGAIVRSLEDGNTKFISARVHNLSHLESIEIYTTGENAALSDVFSSIKNSSEALPDVKDNKSLKGYFEKVFPELDFDRVYVSDMKKMVNWFRALQKHEVDFTPKAEENGTENETEKEPETKAEKKLDPEKEKVTLEVKEDTVPEEGKVKTRKKKTKES